MKYEGGSGKDEGGRMTADSLSLADARSAGPGKVVAENKG